MSSEKIPQFLKELFGPTFKHHQHSLKCSPTADKSSFEYQYTVTLSQYPIRRKSISKMNLSCSTRSHSSRRTNATTSAHGSTSDLLDQTCSDDYVFTTPSPCPSDFECTMMINVKFVLIHKDCVGHQAQSVFSDEVMSHSTVREAILNFQNAFRERLQKFYFTPRVSYCIGEVIERNSRPINQEDLNKKLSDLGDGRSFGSMTFIVDVDD